MATTHRPPSQVVPADVDHEEASPIATRDPAWWLAHAAAGVAAAVVWGLSQPLDKRVLRHDFDTVAYMGRLVTQRAWWPVGMLVHAGNGAAFGLAYAGARRALPGVDPLALAVASAVAEHVGLYPLARPLDRRHPGVQGGHMAPAFTRRSFVQEGWRHVLFGMLLGLLARRIGRSSRDQ